MTERTNPWGGAREWEEGRGPGELLDGWRRACDALEAWGEMNEGNRYELLYIAITDALVRARIERDHFEEEVWMRLAWNKAHGRLTTFGRVLTPMMHRAGFTSASGLLYAAGRMEEPNATERLERLMHGPQTGERMAGYLDGFSEALGLPEDEAGDVARMRLSSTLMGFINPEHAEKAAREAEAEAAEGYMPPPAPDADGPLSAANRALSDAVDRLEGTDDEPPEVLERKRRAAMAVSEAGLLVATEQSRQQREREGASS